MKLRTATLRRLGVLIAAADTALLIGSLPFVAIVAVDTPSRSVAIEMASRLFFVPFLAIGLILVRRRPRNRVGWVLMVGTSALVVNESALAYASYAIERSAPGGVVAAWITSWIWLGAFGALGMLFFVFPTGRPLSRGWGAVMWTGTVAQVVATIGNALWMRPLEGFGGLMNPYGVEGRAGDVVRAVLSVGASVFFISVLLAAVSLLLRLKRSLGDERQQLKWFVFAAAPVSISIFGMAATIREGEPRTPIVVFFMAMAVVSMVFLVVAIGVAILKYRLYDIDVVINRALVYTALTASSVAIYVGLVFGLQALLAPFTSESDLAVAASTLAVAALFRPLRDRLQDVIDRRFYRRKFDAQRTLEVFGSELRDQVDLGSLADRLVGVVIDTMQPSHVSVWLRPVPARNQT